MGAETARQFGVLGAKLVMLGLNQTDLEQDAVLAARDVALKHYSRFDVWSIARAFCGRGI